MVNNIWLFVDSYKVLYYISRNEIVMILKFISVIWDLSKCDKPRSKVRWHNGMSYCLHLNIVVFCLQLFLLLCIEQSC